MPDTELLARMRALGVKWPRGRCLPTYPTTMTEDAKRQADKLYDAMSDTFIDVHSTARS